MWLLQSIRSKRLVESRTGWNRQQVVEHQDRELTELLLYAWANSPFYRDYYGSHGIQATDLREVSVSDLPVVTKEILMEEFDRVIVDPALRRE